MSTWANTVAGWWTSATFAEIERQQRVMLNAITKSKNLKSRKHRPTRRERY
jgi:hypothetical protein